MLGIQKKARSEIPLAIISVLGLGTIAGFFDFRVCTCNRAHVCMKCRSKKHSAKECSRYVRAPSLTTIERFWNAPKQMYLQVIRMTDPQGCDQGPNKTTWIFLLKHVPAIFSERMSLQCSGLLGI